MVVVSTTLILLLSYSFCSSQRIDEETSDVGSFLETNEIDGDKMSEQNYGDQDTNTRLFFGSNKYNLSEIGTSESNGKICYQKVVLQEYTDYTEVTTCVHKTEEMCHTSYVTKFLPHQEQSCDEKFEKSCTIHYEDVTNNENIEVCKTYLCPDCSQQGPQVNTGL